MLLARGEKLIEGATTEVIDAYLRTVRTDAATDLAERKDRDGSGRLRFTGISFESPRGPVDVPVTGEDLDIVLRYESPDGTPVRNAGFAIGVYTVLGSLVLQLQSDVAGSELPSIPAQGEIRCSIPRLPLPAGRYTLNLMGATGGTAADWVQRACELTVAEGDFFQSGRRLPDQHQTVLVDQTWSVGPSPTEVAVLDRLACSRAGSRRWSRSSCRRRFTARLSCRWPTSRASSVCRATRGTSCRAWSTRRAPCFTGSTATGAAAPRPGRAPSARCSTRSRRSPRVIPMTAC
jgi:hypothetical protein